jgi:hypothetical protein
MTFLLPLIMAFTIIAAPPADLDTIDTIQPPGPPPSYEQRPGPPCAIPCVFDDEGNLVCPPCR